MKVRIRENKKYQKEKLHCHRGFWNTSDSAGRDRDVLQFEGGWAGIKIIWHYVDILNWKSMEQLKIDKH